MCFLFFLTIFSLGFGFFQRWRFKKEKERNIDILFDINKGKAREETSKKSIDDLVDENNKRFGPAMGDDDNSK